MDDSPALKRRASRLSPSGAGKMACPACGPALLALRGREGRLALRPEDLACRRPGGTKGIKPGVSTPGGEALARLIPQYPGGTQAAFNPADNARHTESGDA
jgi:hypothetical protein